MTTTLFEDLMNGFKEMEQHLKGEITLPTYTLSLEDKAEKITGEEIKAIRNGLNLSQKVFAQKLKANLKTYQGWEQGKTKPNAQAILLLRVAQRQPHLFEQIAY